jgi:uncharacterized membrane protein YccF (DUF307 family)
MQLGRFFGMIFIFIGGFISAFGYHMLQKEGAVLKICLAGPCLFLMGVAMLFFPGGNITVSESKTKQKEPNVVFGEAPGLHKIVWLVALAVGGVISFVFLK